MFQHFTQWAAPDVLEKVHERSAQVTMVTPVTKGRKEQISGLSGATATVTMPPLSRVTAVTTRSAGRRVTWVTGDAGGPVTGRIPRERAETKGLRTDVTAVTAVTAEIDRGAIEERAAILQYDANMPSDWCDGVARLLAMPKPRRLADQVWRQLLDNTIIFIDRWARAAHGLGWDAIDIWGCHRHRPIERVDGAGVLWLLRGNAIVAMSETAASIRTQTGVVQNYYRKRRRPDSVVPAWNLRE